MNIKFQNLKTKGFISAWQLVTDNRKSVSKFSDLRWFILFEDLYNEEGSLQANKTRGGGWGAQEASLIILSLFANLKLMSAFYS